MSRTPLGSFARLLVALPLISLFLSALAWLRYGMDIPWFDDWRGYAEGTMQSLELAHLFRPINDTMAPVGFLLDALAQRFLDGNSVAYQFLSMVCVLGGILILQWKLLCKALDSALHAAVCFSFTLLMLQPDSYWGRENLAYHQCLPLVFILSALWISVCQDVRKIWHGPLVFALGLLAGLTYISGALGALTVGASLMVTSRLCFSGQARQSIASNASWLVLAGVLTSAMQIIRAILPSSGTHAGIPMALPDEGQFWAFFLGKLGRSLSLSPDTPELSMAVTMFACVVAIALAGMLARRIPDATNIRHRRMLAIYLAIGGMVFVYMMMVAAGRTRFRPPDMNRTLDIFAYAFTRFHFFWATLLWPWVAAAIFDLASRNSASAGKLVQSLPVTVALGLLGVLIGWGGAFDHMRSQRDMSQSRQDASLCLMQGLQREGPINCSGLIPPRFEVPAPDSYGAYAYAWNTGASFVRYFHVLPEAKRLDAVPPFYQMSRILGTLKIDQMRYLGGSKVDVIGRDSKLFIDTLQPGVMLGCKSVEVQIDMKTQLEDTVQVYFLPDGEKQFEEVHSRRVAIKPAASSQTVHVSIDSATGFQDPIRVDLVTQPQLLEVKDIRAYCRQRR